eukprot:TRINITY_DN61999_c0_g1_i1.p1 TRINITY_DN61999_c0_g1~~TRINITY_DN61999_c0_g1_i1.p1  ORF type:complete len:763 (+),score=102.50 TRINITY_DN61999_c0_g1_i1:156-2444(+)
MDCSTIYFQNIGNTTEFSGNVEGPTATLWESSRHLGQVADGNIQIVQNVAGTTVEHFGDSASSGVVEESARISSGHHLNFDSPLDQISVGGNRLEQNVAGSDDDSFVEGAGDIGVTGQSVGTLIGHSLGGTDNWLPSRSTGGTSIQDRHAVQFGRSAFFGQFNGDDPPFGQSASGIGGGRRGESIDSSSRMFGQHSTNNNGRPLAWESGNEQPTRSSSRNQRSGANSIGRLSTRLAQNNADTSAGPTPNGLASTSSSQGPDASSAEQSSDLRKHQQQLMTQLLHNEELSDVVIFVGPEEVPFHAIRALVANVSDPFRAMLCGNFLESRGVVKLPQISTEAFRCILRAAYGLDPALTPEVCIETLIACRIYDVEVLSDESYRYLKNICSTPEAVLTFYSQCIEHDVLSTSALSKALERHFWSVLFTHPEETVSCSAFLTAHLNIILKLVRLDDFQVDEHLLWTRLVERAQLEPGKSCDSDDEFVNGGWCLKVPPLLELVIPHVRFPCMRKEFFIDEAVRYLSRTDVESVLVRHLLGRNTRFCQKPRRWKPCDSLIEFSVVNASHALQHAAKLPSATGGRWVLKSQRLPRSNGFILPTLGVLNLRLRSAAPSTTVCRLEIETGFKHMCREDFGPGGRTPAFSIAGSILAAYCFAADEYQQVMEIDSIPLGTSSHVVQRLLPASAWQLHLGAQFTTEDGTAMNGRVFIKRLSLYGGTTQEDWISEVIERNNLIRPAEEDWLSDSVDRNNLINPVEEISQVESLAW